MSGWPDPDKPGVPLNQDVTGEHYIADSVALWVADLKKWAIIGSSKLQTPELLAGQSWAEYIGPCPTSAEADALRAENARLREALKNLLDRDERHTCQHEETHRGGFLWEICDCCGAKWADDMGGKTEWKDPPEWVAARAALEVKP